MKTLQSILIASIVCVAGCGVEQDSGDRDQSRWLPITFEAPDGELALGGHYDLDNELVVLREELTAFTVTDDTGIVLDLDEEAIALAEGENTVTVPFTLEVGDTMELRAGSWAMELTVQAEDFEGSPAPVELHEAGGNETCSLGPSSNLRVATWGCARSGLNSAGTHYWWSLEDYKTDGSCVEIWARFYNSGAWFRQGRSCGPVNSGLITNGSFSERIRTVRMFRTKTSTSVLFDPPGRYMTLYNG